MRKFYEYLLLECQELEFGRVWNKLLRLYDTTQPCWCDDINPYVRNRELSIVESLSVITEQLSCRDDESAAAHSAAATAAHAAATATKTLTDAAAAAAAATTTRGNHKVYVK